MVDIRQGVRQFPSGKRELNILAGYVSTERAAPTTFSNPAVVATQMWVIVPGQSADAVFGPLPWPAINGSTIPVQGDQVWLCIDNNGTPVVMSWVATYS